MKKQPAIGFAIAMLLVTAIGLHSCKSPKAKTEATTTITLKLSTPDLLLRLSDNNTDPLFLKAINTAIEKQNIDTTSNFLELFHKAWDEVAPNSQLSVIFSTYELRDHINPSSTNNEVISMLNNECYAAFSNTFNVLRSRAERYGVKGDADIYRVGSSDFIQLKIPKIKNLEGLANLLTKPGALGIWETYNNVAVTIDPGVYEMLAKADKLIKEQNKTKKPVVENSNPDYPLFAILQPSIDAYGNAYHSGCVGIAAISDTAQINQMLGFAGTHGIFPNNLRFLWSVKSFHGDDHVELVAIKISTRDGKAPLDGSVITDAKVEQEERGYNIVSFTMNSEGARMFARLTADNIGKALAIVSDGKVFSYPIVNAEITGGQCQISGNFTKKEAEDLAILLSTGALPMHVQLIAIVTEENTAKQ